MTAYRLFSIKIVRATTPSQ